MLQGAGEVLGDEGLLDQHAPGGDGDPGPGPSPPGACWSRRPSSPRTSPAPCSIGATQPGSGVCPSCCVDLLTFFTASLRKNIIIQLPMPLRVPGGGQ